MTITIWFNPRCSKCRDTLALLEAEGIEPEVRRYLEDPPNEYEIRDAIDKLGLPVSEVIRPGEPAFQDMALSEDADPDLLIAAMAENPGLIERPIVFRGDRAVIGRPPRKVLDLL
ncbi:arsenate reductase (glutaredoxin) [Ovoidimarina sediminis]|uniref:arsenate reductase (glutaredoxin) n=1 Tax=Ovoidimarina sediminis TaxID=3079856 RepID=UPI0039778D90